MNFPDIQRLDAELKDLVSGERHALVAFLRRLDVMDRERGYCALNCGSAFEYLTRRLHLCEGTAAGRVTAMRLIRSFPQLEGALEDGRLNPSQLLVLGPILNAGNVDEFIRRATHLTKERTKQLVAALQPREVPADGVRKLPAPAPKPAEVASAGPAWVNPSCPDMMEVSSGPLLLQPACPPPRPPERGRIEPTSADAYQLRARMNEEVKRAYDELAGLLAHRVPDRDPSKLLAIMVRDSLAVQRKQRGLERPTRARRPAPEKPATPGVRQPVPADVRREVLERDGYRCTYVSPEGERCPCTDGLEMDHLHGALVTGSSRADELTARCRPHNLYLAYLRFGRAYVERKIEEARRGRFTLLAEPVEPYGVAA